MIPYLPISHRPNAGLNFLEVMKFIVDAILDLINDFGQSPTFLVFVFL